MKKEIELVEAVQGNARQIKSVKIYDADNDRWLTFSPAERQEAEKWIGEIKHVQRLLFEAILEGINRGFHLRLGYESVKSFVESLGFSRMQTHRYKKIGEVISVFSDRLESEEHRNVFVENAKSLGMGKLYEIFRLSSGDVEALLLDEGVIERNGEKISLQEVKKQSRDVIAETISKINREEKAKNSILKQDIALYKSEVAVMKDKYKKVNEEREKLRRELNLFQEKYGPKVSGLKEKMELLEEAHTVETHLFNLINRVEIEEDDPPELLEKFAFVTNLIVGKVEANAHAWRAIVDAAETAQ